MAFAKDLVDRYRIADPRRFRLADRDAADTGGLASKQKAGAALERGIARLAELQEKLYAQDRWSLLIIFQAMDAAGKDGTIKHVMSGVNPQGCQVVSFKAPSSSELDHDFLWRCACALPQRGRIGIFNRSYYEEVLVVRVHPELLAAQRLPAGLVGGAVWKERFDDINAFERHLARNGTLILKFLLHVSKEEQRKRFLERLEEPDKNWKFSLSDAQERRRWDDYAAAYDAMVRHTATAFAPWYVVPADHKWFTRLVVAEVVVAALERLDLSLPRPDAKRRRDLAAARAELEGAGS